MATMNWQVGEGPKTEPFEIEIEDGEGFFHSLDGNHQNDFTYMTQDYCSFTADQSERVCVLRIWRTGIGLGNVNRFSVPSGELIFD